ncbi:uncharacterized protein ARB_03029 [Trichophyton benhamiae CBS 112371]|uniref:Uncharacterized protein n=1 Tax=Arthroderma benhamiae (strain ATCC MYA-4681 / CBS 112371) TaxID=663331 RepID=D4B3J0_ARTBC|nr:uncharacterized protein ARB_03029 [Trichophyton benhamiae CBS 112371]EFE29688.1 hypothetical protein ARB_03029 [Trichophyton benhamiae CBS 112371]
MEETRQSKQRVEWETRWERKDSIVIWQQQQQVPRVPEARGETVEPPKLAGDGTEEEEDADAASSSSSQKAREPESTQGVESVDAFLLLLLLLLLLASPSLPARCRLSLSGRSLAARLSRSLSG